MSPKTKLTLLLFLFVLLQTMHPVFCQASNFPIREWINEIKGTNDPTFKRLLEIEGGLYKLDSATVSEVLIQLEKNRPASDHYFTSKLLYLQGSFHLRYDKYTGKTYAKQLYAQSLKEAYYTGDEQFVSYISWRYGCAMAFYDEIELAAAYMINAVELNKTILAAKYDSGALWYLGAVLFRARIYDKSMYYSRMAIDSFNIWTTTPNLDLMRAWNTLGRGYQKTGNLDSALLCYKVSSVLASKIKNRLWEGINAACVGQVYYLRGDYERAKPWFESGYSINKNVDAEAAAYSLHWLGRIYLVKNQIDSALLALRTALPTLEDSSANVLQNREYLEEAYYAIGDTYRKAGNSDSFYRYFRLYTRLHDSMQTVMARSSLDVAQMRIDKEKNMYTVQLLERERQSEELKRNFLIGAILLLSIIAVLVLNKQRLQSKYRHQLALQEKVAAEQEMAAAREQLRSFTENILEKTALIEKLQVQLQDQELSTEQQQLFDELSQQTILTEEDWEKFKRLFEKLYPGFFNRLKERTPGITIAELRMAALTRLHLTTKEMASILGISLDSVHKTRQRLRQRLQVSADANLEQSIAGF